MAAPTLSRGLLIHDLGLVDYDEAYRFQRARLAELKASPEGFDHLVLLEHPDVYTYGRRSPDVPSPTIGKVVEVERGGEVTYHNPGQLVSYPVLKLQAAERDLHRILRNLETTIIDVLADFNIMGERRAGATGVWIVGKQRKIASLGIAVSSWITYHGSALNVRNDLAGFSRINPCGFSSEVMTSMERELGEACPSMEQVKESFLKHFCRVFDRRVVV